MRRSHNSHNITNCLDELKIYSKFNYCVWQYPFNAERLCFVYGSKTTEDVSQKKSEANVFKP